MTTREQVVLTLEELAVSAKYPSDEQRFLDAIMLAISEIQGDTPFENDEESLYKKCGGECDKTYEIQGE